MANKELRIPFERITKPDDVTRVNIEEFKKRGLDLHKNEVDRIDDDWSRRERIISVRDKKYFDMGKGKK